MAVIAEEEIGQSDLMRWYAGVVSGKEFTGHHDHGCDVRVDGCGGEHLDGFFAGVKSCELLEEEADEDDERWTGCKCAGKELGRQNGCQEVVTAWQTGIQERGDDVDGESDWHGNHGEHFHPFFVMQAFVFSWST